MDDFSQIKEAIAQHRAEGKRVRFPKAIWQQIIPLTEKYELPQLAKALEINLSNLERRIQQNNGGEKSKKSSSFPSFVKIPGSPQSGTITLELPHGIKLRIEI